jgi:Ca2+-binding EF-hand superfamily protein
MSMSIGGGSGFNTAQLASNLFSKLDTKQQGFIDKSELSSALSGASPTGGSSDTSNADQLFTQLDSNGDGKITQSELSSGLQTLADTLQTQLHQSRMNGANEGFTKDQLTAMASDPSTGSKRADMYSKLAANFDAADTNGDGKLTRGEAMSFNHAHRSGSSSSSGTATAASSDTSSTSSPGSTTASDDSLKMMLQLMQLWQAYGASNSASASASASNSVSVSA